MLRKGWTQIPTGICPSLMAGLAVICVLLVQRADPGREQKGNAKGNWEFFKIKAPSAPGLASAGWMEHRNLLAC